MRVADYIMKRLETEVRHVFFLPGGGSMYLVDALGKSSITPIQCFHEQGAGIAAEAYAQAHGLGVCLVTTGPGGSNAVTACASAYLDSVPVLFISGQVKRADRALYQRQRGMQELDILSIVINITKLSCDIGNPSDITLILESAIEIARTERMGPVWIDIPLDIQSAEM